MAARFLESLLRRFSGQKPNLEQIEEVLIQADLGVTTTERIVASLRERKSALDVATVMQAARQEVLAILAQSPPDLQPLASRPMIILVVGVNGTGKTTSVAKLAFRLKKAGHSVLLAAADTFRAGAIQQLGKWAETTGIPIAPSEYDRDPAAVCHDACQLAARHGFQFVICDTAGRQHTRSNLMQQLMKVKRAIGKIDPTAPHECFLVVDATTGSNAVVQAREFHQAVGVTGLIVTKLDGSGKGGALVAIQEQIGIPTRYLGDGEQIDDLAAFDPKRFVAEQL